MAVDVLELAAFYASPLGILVRRHLRRRIRQIWPDLKRRSLLGFGYATPYLRVFGEEPERTVALMPASQGVIAWPEQGRSLVALTEETALPLADASFDRILLVHALEHSEEVRPLLRELWRVLAPEGRLLLVVPHRRSLWAASDATPFGHGQPFSGGQIARLLEGGLFDPGRPQGALYFPPFGARLIARSPNSWEGIGERLWPGLSGVILIEAGKHLYARPGLPARRGVLAGLPAQPPAVAPSKITTATDEIPPPRRRDWRKSSVH
jgi:SAM-dependent methyltransferase